MLRMQSFGDTSSDVRGRADTLNTNLWAGRQFLDYVAIILIIQRFSVVSIVWSAPEDYL